MADVVEMEEESLSESPAAAAKRRAREARKRKLLENSKNRLDRIRNPNASFKVTPPPTSTDSESKQELIKPPEAAPTNNPTDKPSSATPPTAPPTNYILTIIRLLYCALIGIATNYHLSLLIPLSLLLSLLIFIVMALTQSLSTLPRYKWAELVVAWVYPSGLKWVMFIINVMRGVELVIQDMCMSLFFTLFYHILLEFVTLSFYY